ncbi:ammonium transporter Rh type A-like isoform X2 [Tigriopus californicus]|uniref:ammonium transporter Rh type A-like isoform X2 n=1 Tax=Tigriopus californicus TaxID=6832 RepID=UPI0027DA5142|nr:ammonium transporter Rh type A-like isoform X2 [Tigriopus californicus]
MTVQNGSQKRFACLLSLFQIVIVLGFAFLAEYDPESAQPGTSETAKLSELDQQYPMAMDIQMMLFVGFGFLMTFLKHSGYSALVLTMTIIVTSVEWFILLLGLTRLNEQQTTFGIAWSDVVDGSLASATVLISFGAVIGKISPLQCLVMVILETPLYLANLHIGYSLLTALDAGGTIFIHAFGAYFGLGISFALRNQDVKASLHRQTSSVMSDHFSFLGTMILWVYWPSFNAYVLDGDEKQRAYINTYLSMCSSTITTLIASSICGEARRFTPSHVQNASLAGGVIVGAVANMMLTPFGALLAGGLAGLLSTFGYQVLQDKVLNLGIHDTCGVHNLHGLPGLFGGILSILLAGIATETKYREGLYDVFPPLVPYNTSFLELQSHNHSLQQGLGRTSWEQGLFQGVSLLVTLSIAIFGGVLTGYAMRFDIFNGNMSDQDLYDDELFFDIPEKDEYVQAFIKRSNSTGVFSPQILVNGKHPPPQIDLNIIRGQPDQYDNPAFTDLDEPSGRLPRSTRSSSESTVLGINSQRGKHE